jgi:hypothetical protein
LRLDGWAGRLTWALDATPTEIINAYEGRLDLLKAIFGSPEKDAPASNISMDDKFAPRSKPLGPPRSNASQRRWRDHAHARAFHTFMRLRRGSANAGRAYDRLRQGP